MHGRPQKFSKGGNQGFNNWGTIPRVRNHCGGAPKSPNSVASTFFNMLPKDLRFEHGRTKLVSCPGRYPTSLRPCGQRRNFAYPFQVADDAM